MIRNIVVDKFLGIPHFVATEFGKTVLISGPNGAGKSSIGHAIRLAMGGELARISLKKRAGELVQRGAKSALIHIDQTLVKITAAGAITGVPKDAPEALLCALDMTRFATMSASQRRNLLSGLTTYPGEADVALRMLKRGCDEKLVNEVRSMLLNGFDAALTYAKAQAEGERRLWRELTGEVYGETKAETWTAPASTGESCAGNLNELQDAIDGIDLALDGIIVEMAKLKGQMAAGPHHFCPACGKGLVLRGNELREYDQDDAVDTEALATRINELQRLQKAHVTDKNNVIATMERAKETRRAAADADLTTAQARQHHQNNLAWVVVCEALEPSGIPFDLMEGTLRDLNVMLAEMSQAAGFKGVVALGSDMEPSYGGTLYVLASESEKWRMQALLSLAIARIAGLDLVVLDGLDIIEPASRMGIIGLARLMPVQVVMMATLKQAPELDGVTSYWLG